MSCCHPFFSFFFSISLSITITADVWMTVRNYQFLSVPNTIRGSQQHNKHLDLVFWLCFLLSPKERKKKSTFTSLSSIAPLLPRTFSPFFSRLPRRNIKKNRQAAPFRVVQREQSTPPPPPDPLILRSSRSSFLHTSTSVWPAVADQ